MRDTKPAAFCQDLANSLRPWRKPSSWWTFVSVALTCVVLAQLAWLHLTMPISALDHLTLLAILGDAGESAPALRDQLLARFDVMAIAELPQHRAGDARDWLATRIAVLEAGAAVQWHITVPAAGGAR